MRRITTVPSPPEQPVLAQGATGRFLEGKAIRFLEGFSTGRFLASFSRRQGKTAGGGLGGVFLEGVVLVVGADKRSGWQNSSLYWFAECVQVWFVLLMKNAAFF